MGARRTWLILAGLAAHSAACAGASVSSGIEDKARRDIPIAVCRKALVPADLDDAGAPKPEAFWKVLVPSFHGFGLALDPDATSCVGDPAQPLDAKDGAATRLASVSAQAETVAPLGDGLDVVWLRTVAVSDRVSRGLLALVGPRPSEIDVYSLGTYEGSTLHSRFELVRLGATTILAARDESCADSKVDAECESVASLYVVSGGALAPSARVITERQQAGTMKEVGNVKYRLTTDPFVVEPTALHVKEHLSVRDANDEEVRKAERDRVFTLSGGELTSKLASIWPDPPPPGPAAPREGKAGSKPPAAPATSR